MGCLIRYSSSVTVLHPANLLLEFTMNLIEAFREVLAEINLRIID
tara:strand:- start:54 stop:188 length:135 start_codon:yes stop_codon:yes gene_type:complete